jgi:hypothetical protein
MTIVIAIQLMFIFSALSVIVTGLRAVRADIQRLIEIQERAAGPRG